jgi:hypothetical protein
MWSRLRAALFGPRQTPAKTQPLALPRRRDDVVDWVPPPPRRVAASAHARALISLLQSEGKTGPVPHWVLTGNYPEVCWREGFEQLSERLILEAIGNVCAKVRINNMDRGDGVKGKVSCYVIPGPKHRGNVVTLPNGNMEDIPWPELPKRSRAGTSHAQA